MRKIHVIGIGAGDPRHMTVQAIEALNASDAVFLLDKGEDKAGLVQIREAICARFLTNRQCRLVRAPSPPREAGVDYRPGVEAWHSEKAALYTRLIRDELGGEESGAFLVWGDPALYDSTLRVLAAVRATGIAFDVIVVPGITAAQALAAAHRIPLNRIGEPVVFTTARKLREDGLPAADSIVFLDSGEALAGLPADGLDIWWGACLGTPDEALVAGSLAAVRDDILRIRRRIRDANGWVMDVYLLRRSSGGTAPPDPNAGP